MEAAELSRLVADVERWFVRRGLPHAIDDYSAREDVLTRTIPLLSLVFVVEVITITYGRRFSGWAQLGVLVAALALSLGAVALVNTWRGRRRFQLPNRIGAGELAVFVVVPAALAWIVDGSVVEAIVIGLANLALVAVAFAFAYFGVLPMIAFGLRQVRDRLQRLVQLVARVMPLLLLFVTFVFFNAEMWQVANDFRPGVYAVVTGAIAAIALLFVAVQLPGELEVLSRFESWDEVCRIARDSKAPPLPSDAIGDGQPKLTLDRRDHRNLSVLLFVSFAVQVVLIGLIVAVTLVVLGVLAIREQTIVQWTVQDGDTISALWTFALGDARYALTWEHLAVAGFIAVFAMLQFAVQLLRDERYRADFYADVAGEIREVLAVQALYEQVITRAA